MYILYSCYIYEDMDEPYKDPVAKFSRQSYAEDYVEKVTLEKFPNGNRRFRRDSLLSCAKWAEIEKEEVKDFPINPLPPSKPPGKEYLVILNEKFDKMRILCHNLESAQRELDSFKGEGRIEERLI